MFHIVQSLQNKSFYRQLSPPDGLLIFIFEKFIWRLHQVQIEFQIE